MHNVLSIKVKFSLHFVHEPYSEFVHNSHEYSKQSFDVDNEKFNDICKTIIIIFVSIFIFF